MTDDELDARLADAGARWRERNSEAVGANFAALVAAGEGPESGADTVERAAAQPLPLVPDRAPKDRRRKRIRIGSAVAAAVACVAAAVVIVQVVGSGSPVTSGPAAGGGTSLTGTDWELAATANGGAAPGVRATLRISPGGELSGSDGCNSFGGKATISDRALSISHLMHTMMGCLGEAGTTGAAVDRVLDGNVRYAIDGDTLTLSKSGAGTLTYTAQPPATTSTDPAAIEAITWQLESVQLGDNVARPYGGASSAPPGAQIALVGGRLTGNDGCNDFTAKVEVGAGTIAIADFAYTTSKFCTAQASPGWTLVLKGATHWTTIGQIVPAVQLTLTDAHGGKLVFSRDIDPGFFGSSASAPAQGLPSATATS